MGLLGYKVFEPLEPKLEPSNGKTISSQKITELFFEKKNKTIMATCLRTVEGFIVKRESKIELTDSLSIPSGIKQKRETMKGDKINADGVLLEDILFKSPSYAAAFVAGYRVNGWKTWKTEDGRTLKEIEIEETKS